MKMNGRKQKREEFHVHLVFLWLVKVNGRLNFCKERKKERCLSYSDLSSLHVLTLIHGPFRTYFRIRCVVFPIWYSSIFRIQRIKTKSLDGKEESLTRIGSMNDFLLGYLFSFSWKKVDGCSTHTDKLYGSLYNFISFLQHVTHKPIFILWFNIIYDP